MLKSKNKSLLYLALILACILAFCGALVLSVFTAEKVAFAEDTLYPNTFNQLIKNGFTPSVGSGSPWEIYNSSYTDSVTQNEFYSWINGNSSSSGYGSIQYNVSSFLDTSHEYLLRVNLYYNRDGNISITLPHGQTYSYNLDALVNNTLYLKEIFISYTPSTSFGDYLRFSCNTSMKSFGISNVEFIDLSLLNFFPEVSTPSKSWYIEHFGDMYHYYTVNTPISEIKSYTINQAYHDGYLSGIEDSYDVGYADGYMKAIDEINGKSIECDESFFSNPESPSLPLFQNVVGNYWTIYGRTYNDLAFMSLNIGYLDIFGESFSSLADYSVSFGWLLPTCSVTNGVLSYDSQYFTSSYVGFYQNQGLLYLSDSIDSTDPLNDYHILIKMGAHSSDILCSYFTSSTQNADSVPNFYSGAGIDIYKLTFFVDYPAGQLYQKAFNEGVSSADNRLNETSVSYNTGYNRGVESAGNYTFPSIISAAIDVPVQTARSLLNFEVFGVNLNNFVLSLLSFGVVVGILKLILGR